MTKDEKVRFTLRLPSSLYKRLAENAREKGLAVNSEILNILWGYIKKTNPELKERA